MKGMGRKGGVCDVLGISYFLGFLAVETSGFLGRSMFPALTSVEQSLHCTTMHVACL